jgi:hypothetical protein
LPKITRSMSRDTMPREVMPRDTVPQSRMISCGSYAPVEAQADDEVLHGCAGGSRVQRCFDHCTFTKPTSAISREPSQFNSSGLKCDHIAP